MSRTHPPAKGGKTYRYQYIDPTLAGYVGEDVLIRYDPADLAEIRVFFEERYVCRAICPELSALSRTHFRSAEQRASDRRVDGIISIL
jgi:hypothetical protein